MSVGVILVQVTFGQPLWRGFTGIASAVTRRHSPTANPSILLAQTNFLLCLPQWTPEPYMQGAGVFYRLIHWDWAAKVHRN